jgi:hypothetical protein
MANNPSDTLLFTISTHDLQLAITRLQDRGGASLYQPTWRVLTTELGKRRELKVGLDEISLARQHFEPLPEEVKVLFSPKQPRTQ